eukprot:scaffold546_cov352-Prasinococcus_capsulatus_cf.AAC.3
MYPPPRARSTGPQRPNSPRVTATLPPFPYPGSRGPRAGAKGPPRSPFLGRNGPEGGPFRIAAVGGVERRACARGRGRRVGPAPPRAPFGPVGPQERAFGPPFGPFSGLPGGAGRRAGRPRARARAADARPRKAPKGAQKGPERGLRGGVWGPGGVTRFYWGWRAALCAYKAARRPPPSNRGRRALAALARTTNERARGRRRARVRVMWCDAMRRDATLRARRGPGGEAGARARSTVHGRAARATAAGTWRWSSLLERAGAACGRPSRRAVTSRSGEAERAARGAQDEAGRGRRGLDLLPPP